MYTQIVSVSIHSLSRYHTLISLITDINASVSIALQSLDIVIIYCYFVCLQGILGTVNSGKSALVHRYLTGSYMQEESPEGQ